MGDRSVQYCWGLKVHRNIILSIVTLPKVTLILSQRCAKQSLAYLAGESPVVEGEPIPLRSESCVIGGNKDDEA